jgi:AcrR family transcriptional regulator
VPTNDARISEDELLGGLANRRRREEVLAAAAAKFASSGYVLTSLKDIGDSCGILPGSLYHHFDSKEAIAVELVERYKSDLDTATETILQSLNTDPRPLYDRLLSISGTLAALAARHVAAVHLTLYEPPAQASERLVALTLNVLEGIEGSMNRLLDGEQPAIEPRVDRAVLAVEICDSLVRVALDGLYPRTSPKDIGELLSSLLLLGIASEEISSGELDASEAMRLANLHVQDWIDATSLTSDDRMSRIQSLARDQFARRGYEATTIRHIAAAVGEGTGSIYRLFGSKQALLESIMKSYFDKLSAAYSAIVSSDSTTIEKLDALTWLNINAQQHFSQEYRIQLAWLRETPPDVEWRDASRAQRARMVTRVVEYGLRSGELGVELRGGAVPAVRSVSMCIRALMWPPTRLVEKLGSRSTLVHSRNTLLQGALVSAARPSEAARH